MSDDKQEPIESDLTPDEANRIIHTHRKVRYGKLHFPLVPQAPVLKFHG